MLRSSYDACGCSAQTTSTINLKRSTLHPHEGQADRPNTPSDSANASSNPSPPATNPPDVASYFWFRQSQYGRRKRILRHGPSLNNSAPPINTLASASRSHSATRNSKGSKSSRRLKPRVRPHSGCSWNCWQGMGKMLARQKPSRHAPVSTIKG